MKFQFEEKQKKWGLTAFLVIVASIVVFFVIYRFDVFSQLLSVGMAILTPFIYGMVFAYLLCPI